MENMNKKAKRNYLIYAILFVIILILATLAITYAFYAATNTAAGTTNANATLDCINITYSEENTIDLDYAYPISDDYAIANVKPVTIKVENHCSKNVEAVNYALILTSLANETGYIPDTKIRTYVTKSINSGTEENVQETSYVSKLNKLTNSTMLNSLNIELDAKENIKDYTKRTSYSLHTGSIEAGTIQEIKVYLWVDYYEGDMKMYNLEEYPDYEHDETYDNSTENLEYAAAVSLYVNPVINEPESICNLADDSSVAAGEYGAKYNCKVDPNKPEYTFYLLDNNEDGTSDLIMNANINNNGNIVLADQTENNGLVQWINEEDYGTYGSYYSANTEQGPVTAMKYLYNATKSWTNVEPLNYEYYDKEYQNVGSGYESFVSQEGIANITAADGTISAVIGSNDEPLRVRMPIYSNTWSSVIPEGDEWEQAPPHYNQEIYEKGDVRIKYDNTEFLYDNLDEDWTDGEGTVRYWTMSSSTDSQDMAYNVDAIETDPHSNMVNSYAGVRPIINVRL